ncbi:MAG: MFS transporter [Oceanicaulis sp.]
MTPLELEGGAKTRGPGRIRKYFVIGSLSAAHDMPLALTGIMAPTIFVREAGMPVEWLGVFGIPLVVQALKWLWAPLVDRTGSERFGRRRSWILPASLAVSLLYAVVAGVEPTLGNLPLIITLFVLIKFAFSTHEIAADAYVVESLRDSGRSVGSAVVWFGKELGQIAGLAGMLIVADQYGWGAAFLSAGLLFSALNLTILLRKEPAPDPAVMAARAAGRKVKVLNYVREPVNRRVLALVFVFALAAQMTPAIIGPFLSSKGLSLSEVGVSIGIAASIGAGLSLAVSSVVLEKLGPRRMVLLLIPVGLLALPAFLWLAFTGEPALALVIAAVFWGSICTAPQRMVFYAARLGWTSRGQTGTDFTIQQATYFLGGGAAIAISGLIAGLVGWTAFFLVNAVLVVTVLVLFAWSYAPIQKSIEALQAEELRRDVADV